MSNIGFIGIGTMGFPMANNLIRNNHTVSFFDPYTNKTNELIKLGGLKTSSIKEVCDDKKFIISMLPIGKNVKDIALGSDGIISQPNKDLIYIDMSTILPSDSINISKALKDTGIRMCDAPVARLVNNAIDGTLLIMVGGEKNDFEIIKPILECMGSDVYHCGPSGSGSKMKIINNYMAIVSNIVTAETLSLVKKSGIDLNFAINLMSTTAAGKGHMNFSYPKKVLNNDIEPGFKNELALKDLKLALDYGIKEGIDLKTGKCILPIYEEAVNSKYKDLDWTAMYNFIKEKNKLD